MGSAITKIGKKPGSVEACPRNMSCIIQDLTSVSRLLLISAINSLSKEICWIYSL